MALSSVRRPTKASFAKADSQIGGHPGSSPSIDLCRRLPVTYLEKSEMSSTGKILLKCSLQRWILTIIILCTIVWWAPAETLAQEAAPAALDMTAHSTLWSLEGPGSNNAPYLVIGMADRGDTPSYGSLRIAEDEATNPSVGNTITRQGGPAASANRTEKIESGPLVLSSLLDPTAGVPGLTNFRVEPISARQTIQRSPDLARAKVYRLVDDRSAPRSFLYGYQANYLPSKQRLANNESFTHEVVQAPRPLFELEFGGWHLPVMLSGAAVSR
jgi:hypothetical protein